jgi:Uma2 family endonuclease
MLAGMAHPIRLHRYSFEEYLAVEEVARVRHEFLDGEIYAMAGGTPEHAALGAAATAMLGAALRGGPCRVYSSDLRVRILQTGLATYPDVTVICGRSERDPQSPTHVVNPTLIVEVLSDGTEDYDRGEKLEHYKRVPSLGAVMLVDHRQRRIELWTRVAAGFVTQVYGPGQTLELQCIGCSLAVDELYDFAAES